MLSPINLMFEMISLRHERNVLEISHQLVMRLKLCTSMEINLHFTNQFFKVELNINLHPRHWSKN